LCTEGLVAIVAWHQGQLPLMVVDLFPPPRLAYDVDGQHLYFNYGRATIDKNFSVSWAAPAAVYPAGLRQGFTLVGTIPPSLTAGLLEIRTNPWTYFVTPVSYLTLRIMLTLLILWISGVVLLVQARWLGTIAALGAHRQSAPDG